MQSGSRSGAVNVRGTDDGCCGVFFLKYVLYIFNVILVVSNLNYVLVV